MDLDPPAGSQISINRKDLDPTIIIPATASSMRYFGGVFLLFWLGGWVMGETSAITQLMSGKGGAFIIFWLGGWTVGGILAALTAYQIFRPTVPETLQLKRGSIAYDSGIPPFELNQNTRNKGIRDYWSSLLSRRLRTDLDRQQLQTLRLRETETGNRLTIDLGAQRLELASHASEVEREWLARLLTRRYGLTQALPGREVADA
jgi:hypothetical protein